jgi:hypothetical protein
VFFSWLSSQESHNGTCLELYGYIFGRLLLIIKQRKALPYVSREDKCEMLSSIAIVIG